LSETLAGFGTPAWLPLSVQRAQADEERAEAQQTRQHETELKEACERRRAGDLALRTEQYRRDGGYLDPLAAVLGHVPAVAFDPVAAAAAAEAREDGRAAADARKASGERLGDYFVGELAPPPPKAASAEETTTEAQRAVVQRARAFAAAVSAQQRADQQRGEAALAAAVSQRHADQARTSLKRHMRRRGR
jgi:hypothetical protein